MGSCLSTPKKQKNKPAPTRRARNDENANDMVALRPVFANKINTAMYEDLKAHKEKCERLSRENKERLDEMQKTHDQQLEVKDGQINKLNGVLTKQVSDVGYNDDTWYTLSKDLNGLAGKMRDLTTFMKPYFNPENKPIDDIVEFFKTCWTEDLGYDENRRETTIRQVDKLFRDKPTYEVVGVLVEKLLSDYFVHKIYLVSLHTGFHDENKAYECLDNLLKEKNADTVKQVRVMMSNAISNRIQTDEAWKDRRAKSKKELAEEITNHLGKIYNPKKIKKNVKDIVFKAVSLSLPMHTQRYDIIIHNLETDGVLYTDEVDPLIPYDVNSNKVFLGIYPVIYSDENPLEDDDEGSDDNDDQEDEEVSGGSDDEQPVSRKETKKGKQKQKKIENKGSYYQKYSVMKGKAVGYELR
jgi:esterase/lipase